MKVKLIVLAILISISSYSQKKVKTIYTPNYKGMSNSYLFTSFDKKGKIIKKGTCTIDMSDLGYERFHNVFKIDPLDFKVSNKIEYEKPKKVKKKEVFNEERKLISSTTFIEEGFYKGLDATKNIYYYKNKGNLYKEISYYTRIDTLDLGYEQFNAGEKISPEYIEHSLEKDVIKYYKNGKVTKQLDYTRWGIFGTLFDYNNKGELLTKYSYKFYSDKDQLEYFNNDYLPFTEDKIYEKLIYKYKYDEFGNWVIRTSFKDKNEIKTKETRFIEYYN